MAVSRCIILLTVFSVSVLTVKADCVNKTLSSWNWRRYSEDVGAGVETLTVNVEHYDHASYCKEGSGFGHSGSTVWVDNGCRAQFTLCTHDGMGEKGHYYGCFTDRHARDLGFEIKWAQTNTPEKCIERCLLLGQKYAGLQYGTQCFCGNSYGKHGRHVEEACNYKCSGDSSLTCGGKWANAVYDTGITLEPLNAPTIEITYPIGSQADSSVTITAGHEFQITVNKSSLQGELEGIPTDEMVFTLLHNGKPRGQLVNGAFDLFKSTLEDDGDYSVTVAYKGVTSPPSNTVTLNVTPK